MSRIGKMPIQIHPKVEVAIDGSTVAVKGPRGGMSHRVPQGIDVAVEGSKLVLRRRDDSKEQKALHGLARALLANAVHGVTEGFSKRLEIHGVGYRAEVSGRMVKLSLGYTHPIAFPIPEGIQIVVERNVVTVTGHDRQLVGQVAADLRALRPPDVYKQKGVRYADEKLRKKAGKTGAK
jgi:large subunit ribosomal protein L6